MTAGCPAPWSSDPHPGRPGGGTSPGRGAKAGRRVTTTLWCLTGPLDLVRDLVRDLIRDLIRDLDRRARLPEQPLVHPALHEEYEIRIACDWNVRRDGVGFVPRRTAGAWFPARYPIEQADGRAIFGLRVPVEEHDGFNAHVVGGIQVVHREPGRQDDPAPPGWSPTG